MQKVRTMQSPAFALIPLPYELLEEAEFSEGDLIQFTASDGVVTMKRIQFSDTDYICDEDCESCPVELSDCDGNCRECPCKYGCEESEVM